MPTQSTDKEVARGIWLLLRKTKPTHALTFFLTLSFPFLFHLFSFLCNLAKVPLRNRMRQAKLPIHKWMDNKNLEVRIAHPSDFLDALYIMQKVSQLRHQKARQMVIPFCGCAEDPPLERSTPRRKGASKRNKPESPRWSEALRP